MQNILFKIAAFVVLLLSLSASSTLAQNPSAHCLLRGTTNGVAPGLKGTVTFTQTTGSNVTTIQWTIDQSTVPTAMAGKKFGFHVHEFGYIADAGSTGGHYNPFATTHALPDENTYPAIHVGDLGNIDLGVAYSGSITTKLLTFSGPQSVIGRAIRLHNATDSGKAAQPTGNAGVAAAHCVIGISNVATNTAVNDVYNATMKAVAVLQKTNTASTNVTGRIVFETLGETNMTRVTGKICNLLPSTSHGIHIHQFGELNLEDGLRTGGHYNPFGATHGYPGNPNRHVGDLGNITTDSNGVASFDFAVDLVRINSIYSILGRGLVIHANKDDGNSSTPTGNAGGRIAIATIGVPSGTVSLSVPNDACVDPAPPKVIVNPTASQSKKVSAATTISSISSLLVTMIVAVIALL